MNKKTTLDMTEGKVIRVLLVFTIPIFISNLFQQFYNVVDVAVIGHILGDNALAAVGATSSIYSLVIGFINGMSNGFCMIIARYFGGNDQDNFQKSVRFSIILSFATTVVLTIASLLVLKPLLRLLHTPVDILDLSQSYISVIMLFCCVTFAYNLLSSMLRAIGNSYIPLYALVIASVLNVILDIIFVKTLNMGVRGAAFATVIAQGFSVFFLLVYIVKYCPLLHINIHKFTIDRTILLELLTTGFSMAMMLVLTNIGTVVLQGSINSFGTSTITGHTAARKFHDLCMLPLGTICTSAAAFVSQNYGARKKERIKQGIAASIFLGTIWSILILIVVLLTGQELIHALTGSTDAEVIGISIKYLYWNVPFYVVLNILLIMRNSLQALGNKKLPVIASVVELIGKFAGAFLLSRIIGYLGICLTEPITWLICVPIVLAGFVQKIKQISKI